MAAACSGPTFPETPAGDDASATAARHGIELRPAALTFTRTPQGFVEIPYTVVNAGEASVLITSRCGDRLVPVIERYEGNRWTQHAGGLCQAIYPSSPVPITPGTRRDDVAFVNAPGQYRIVLGTEHGGVPSPAFTVR